MTEHYCLALSRDLRAENGIIDLRPLKAYTASLPDFCPADPDWYAKIDTASAIAFHIRMAFSFFFSSLRPTPQAEKKITSGDDLLKELGL